MMATLLKMTEVHGRNLENTPKKMETASVDWKN
jgi:hypothetical protein